MKSVVELEINAPREQVARLFTDPANTTKWMDDLAAYIPISGEPGAPGSKYRLVPKGGDPLVATVLATELPTRSRLELEAATVVVSVEGTFEPIAPDRTRLVSEEVFRFRGARNKLVGLFTRRAIRKAHRRQMDAFKRFAERTAAS